MDLATRIADLSTLWKQASAVFPYFDRLPIDWDQTYRAYLPRVMSTETERDLHLLLAEFLNLLGDGHTDYWFPQHLIEETGVLPFALKHLSSGYYVQAIEPDGKRHLSARVLGVNGVPMEDILSDVFRYAYHVDNYVYPLRLHQLLPFLLRPAGNVLETSAGSYAFDLAKSAPALIAHPAPTVSVPCEKITGETLDMRLYGGSVLYVKLDDFQHSGAAAEIAAALDRDLGGVILDLRDNIGGMTLYGAKVAELFLSGEFCACQKRTRTMTGIDVASASQYARMSEEQIERCIVLGQCDREEVERCRKINANAFFREYSDSYGAPDHQAKYSGPCVVLTSRDTISAAEDFVAMLRSNARATVIGTPTCGTTGTPLLQALSCGGHARICSVGYRLLDGTEFIGRGIAPDIEAEQTPADYENGVDTALHLALRQFGL